ncbi:MAG: type II toxin-antitoxin system PemK/MazF family toxin [Gammaproteobacteria bacterium]|nr:type II toxin-antitoxin system PemK/MazF family toxin [Gammaproteobacteria bacterium]
MRRGEVYWATLPDPIGSGPGFRRPVLIVQTNEFNESAIRTVICMVVTSNRRLASAPGNVQLSKKATALGRDSVANVSQLITLDKRVLTQRVGRLPQNKMHEIDEGLRLVLGL